MDYVPYFGDLIPFFSTFSFYLGGPNQANLLFTTALLVGSLYYCMAYALQEKLVASERLVMNKQALAYPYDIDCVVSRMHGLAMDNNFFTYLYNSCKIIPQIILVRGQSEVTQGGTRPALGIINGDTMSWTTYSECQNEIQQIASGMRAQKLVSKVSRKVRPECVGVCAPRGPEHTIIEHSIILLGGVYVPVHNHYGNDTMMDIIRRTRMRTLFIGDVEKGKVIIERRPLTLKHLVAFESVGMVLKTKANLKGLSYHTLSSLKRKGGRKLLDLHKQMSLLLPNRVVACFFTVNHSEKSRGVLLTHENLLSAATAVAVHLDQLFLSPDDVYLANVGRHHAYEMLWNLCVLMQGAKLVYGTGDIQSDLRVARPSFLVTPPWVVNEVYDNFVDTYNSMGACTRMSTDCGFTKKLSSMERSSMMRGTFMDMKLGRQVQKAFGGRVRIVIVSGGPIFRDVVVFMRACLNCFVLQSYGAAETSGVACMTVPGDNMVDHVGPPLPCNHIKLIHPELFTYTQVTPLELLRRGSYVGEIGIRGTNVAKEYIVWKDDKGRYSKEEMVLLVTDGQDFFRTNDLGRILSNGAIQLVGRKKINEKNASGEWICPVHLEKILRDHVKVIEGIHLHVDRYRFYTIAFVNAKESNAQSELVLNEILQSCATSEKVRDLKSYQVPQAVVIARSTITKADHAARDEILVKEHEHDLEETKQMSPTENQVFGRALQDMF